MTVLKEYVQAITGVNGKKAQDYKEAESYYDGTVSERFASAKLRHVLRTTGHRGQQNYCRIVVDSVLNRLEIANIVGSTDKATSKITEIWDSAEVSLEANEIHRRALEYGDAYALVWPDKEGEWQIAYQSPRTTAIVYDVENPKEKLYAVKVWQHTDKLVRMNVYTPDAILKFSAEGTEYTEGTNWTAIGSEDNPFDEVPVFHFRTNRPLGKPEHLQAYGAQDDINKLLATHMFTVDYQGAPQRYALAMQGASDVPDFSDDDAERENVNALKASPGSLWYLNGIEKVGEFAPADPEVFLKPVAALKQSIAALTDTPFHYLDRTTNVTAGPALRVAEAPMLKKVADRQTSFAATWRELFNFILKVEKISARLTVQWADIESFDALDKWDVILKKINGGLSHAQALREGGYEEKEIERILAERAEEAAASSFYNRTDANGQQSLQNVPAARVSTNDNAANNENRNGLTEAAKVNGGRGMAA